jgi:hypothetical protein
LAAYRKRPFSGLDALTVWLFVIFGLMELAILYVGSQMEVRELSQEEIQEFFATRFRRIEQIKAPEAAAPIAEGLTTPTDVVEEQAEVGQEERAEREVLDRPVERQQGSAQQAEARRGAAAERRASRREAISQELVNSTGGIALVTGSSGGAAARGLVDAAQVTGGGAVSTEGLVGMVTGQAAENARRLKTDGPKGGGSGGVNLQGALTGVDVAVGGGTVGDLLEGGVQTYDRSGKFAGEQARSAEALRAAIAGYSPGLKDCYERQLQRDRGLKGSVLAKFTIKADGSVADVELTQPKWSDPNAGRRVESCLKQKISSWRFDPIDPSMGDFKMGQKMAFGS